MHVCEPVSVPNACCVLNPVLTLHFSTIKQGCFWKEKAQENSGFARRKLNTQPGAEKVQTEGANTSFRCDSITSRSPQEEGPALPNPKLEQKGPDRDLESNPRNPLPNPAEIPSLLKAKQNDKGLTSLKGTRAKSGKTS